MKIASTDHGLILGIDPGLHGAYALLDSQGRLGVADHFPIGDDEEIDAAELRLILEENGPITHAFVERVGSMGGAKNGRRQGVQGMFNFGRRYGAVLAVLQIAGIPYTLVEPRVWKAATGVSSDKGTSLAAARKLWPCASDLLRRVKDEARAEAALIARYGQLTTYSHRRAP